MKLRDLDGVNDELGARLHELAEQGNLRGLRAEKHLDFILLLLQHVARELKNNKSGSLAAALKILQTLPGLADQDVENMATVFVEEPAEELFSKVKAAYQDVVTSIGLHHASELAGDTAMLTKLLRLMQ